MTLILLTPLDLTLTASLIVILALISHFTHMGVTASLLIAATRTVIQLLLIGLVLKILFDNVHVAWIVAISVVMVSVAGYEVTARQKHRFTGPWSYTIGISTMFVSSFCITILALVVIIQPQPWYQPQYAVPLLGMMLGNTMNGVALSVDRLTTSIIQNRAIIEAQLILGDSAPTAIRDLLRDSIRTGMIPIINGMAAAGLVSLPGMMTGQILSGTAPLEAVKYQILIMFLITASTGFSTLLAGHFTARRLFDERHRLRLDRLRTLK